MPEHLPPPVRHARLRVPFHMALTTAVARLRRGDDGRDGLEGDEGMWQRVFMLGPAELSAAHASAPRPFGEAVAVVLLAYCKCAVAAGALGRGAAA